MKRRNCKSAESSGIHTPSSGFLHKPSEIMSSFGLLAVCFDYSDEISIGEGHSKWGADEEGRIGT